VKFNIPNKCQQLGGNWVLFFEEEPVHVILSFFAFFVLLKGQIAELIDHASSEDLH